MFTLKIAGQSFGVRFQYRPVYLQREGHKSYFTEDAMASIGLGVRELDGRKPDSTRTVCQILKLDDEKRTSELFCEGEATCSLADKFSKVEGRQRSLTKALSCGAMGWHPDRPTRKLVWNAYFANHKDLRPKKNRVERDKKLLNTIFGKDE
ncbi:hypothetical protein HN803_00080 [candidate division WWE3 bacterium]|jgi:hypothetical protein|nr:hypothetical protein [Candidatus Scalindua sp.]MBT7349182.1 hypothetical protein [candidate division WWE3 bacterium]